MKIFTNTCLLLKYCVPRNIVDTFILRLDFLTYCSYVKLGITLIKYVPQAVMNYRSVHYITVQCLYYVL